MTKGTHTVTAAEWQAVAKKRIAFGHQSVGANILSGVKTLAKEAGVSLKVIESKSDAREVGITHFGIGRNSDPLSKINDFAEVIKRGMNPDIALMKLCFIDIVADTDAKKLAQYYISSLDSLSHQFPKTIFVAVTTPLTTVQSNPKAWIKSLLGRSSLAENLRRQEFNNILRSSYGSKGRLFDLAKLEAEGAVHYSYKGQSVETMNPSIATADGGHLNDSGAQLVASALLKFIAGLCT